MRPEFEIVKDITALKEKYHAGKTSGEMTVKEDEALSGMIKMLTKELNATLTEGAKPLEGVAEDLIGVRINGRTNTGQAVSYEIGQGGLRSVGNSKEEVVHNWNEGIYFKKVNGLFEKV